jgi:hypothetical protein
LLQIVPAKGAGKDDAMTPTEYLLDQAERAERLASCVLDPLTIGRLNDFAAECRKTLEGLAPERACSPMTAPVP